MNGSQKEFTGRHMLVIMVAFFGVIITVNVTMAVFARTSWTGLVVQNSYVASQQFNDKAAGEKAQAALGFTPRLAIDGASISYALVDRAGKPVPIAGASATFHRPVTTRQDTHVAFAVDAAGKAVGTVELGDGVWVMELIADIRRDHSWRDMRRIVVRDGRFE